jgi:hypothetical protein
VSTEQEMMEFLCADGNRTCRDLPGGTEAGLQTEEG